MALAPLAPTQTARLFNPLHGELVALLRSLGADAWRSPTIAGSWRVRDVAAHLLDGELRKIAVLRDGHRLTPPAEAIASPGGLTAWLNALNAEGVRAAERLSPRLITDLLAWSGPVHAALVASIDPEAPAVFAVSWAGESESLHWMDTGREYTERWHHQQQIREAVGAPLLLGREWLLPTLEISVRALPVTYRGVDAPAGSSVRFHVTGEGGGSWTLVRSEAAWTLFAGEAEHATATLSLDGDAAWRLFFKALSPADAEARVRLSGDEALARVALGSRAVMV
jgi:uncharacterized protein (TIGR03083 family)